MDSWLRRAIKRIRSLISVRYTLVFFGLMAVLYLFSIFGSVFGGADFTYVEY